MIFDIINLPESDYSTFLSSNIYSPDDIDGYADEVKDIFSLVRHYSNSGHYLAENYESILTWLLYAVEKEEKLLNIMPQLLRQKDPKQMNLKVINKQLVYHHPLSHPPFVINFPNENDINLNLPSIVTKSNLNIEFKYSDKRNVLLLNTEGIHGEQQQKQSFWLTDPVLQTLDLSKTILFNDVLKNPECDCIPRHLFAKLMWLFWLKTYESTCGESIFRSAIGTTILNVNVNDMFIEGDNWKVVVIGDNNIQQLLCHMDDDDVAYLPFQSTVEEKDLIILEMLSTSLNDKFLRTIGEEHWSLLKIRWPKIKIVVFTMKLSIGGKSWEPISDENSIILTNNYVINPKVLHLDDFAEFESKAFSSYLQHNSVFVDLYTFILYMYIMAWLPNNTSDNTFTIFHGKKPPIAWIISLYFNTNMNHAKSFSFNKNSLTRVENNNDVSSNISMEVFASRIYRPDMKLLTLIYLHSQILYTVSYWSIYVYKNTRLRETLSLLFGTVYPFDLDWISKFDINSSKVDCDPLLPSFFGLTNQSGLTGSMLNIKFIKNLNLKSSIFIYKNEDDYVFETRLLICPEYQVKKRLLLAWSILNWIYIACQTKKYFADLIPDSNLLSIEYGYVVLPDEFYSTQPDPDSFVLYEPAMFHQPNTLLCRPTLKCAAQLDQTPCLLLKFTNINYDAFIGEWLSDADIISGSIEEWPFVQGPVKLQI